MSYLYDNSVNVLKVEKFDINSSLSLGKTEFTYDTTIPNRLSSVTKDVIIKTITYNDALQYLKDNDYCMCLTKEVRQYLGLI